MPKASFVAGDDEAQRRHPEIALWSERADIERFSDPESNDRFLEPRERVAGLQRRMFPQDATEREILRFMLNLCLHTGSLPQNRARRQP
jgi:hypothetical protein